MGLFKKPSTREKGRAAEERACLFLKKQGYRILKRNWYLGFGEIDILAKNRSGEICLFEVKYQSTSLARAKEQVDWRKQKKLRRLYLAVAKCYPKNNLRLHILAMSDEALEIIEDAIEEIN